ncbi:MAG TPA: efflux RND transporter periplasmic adaptor subunit [Methylomirabilota bacterium]|jgi:biotin carboxyl carrier protein|nr:efflux RND transporter periplasmic adaptor subunit [Methylomirabilota bacterium]
MTVGERLPQFRSDLEVVPTTSRFNRTSGCIIRDPKDGWTYELGEEAYFICQQLDGATTLETVRTRYQERFHTPIELDRVEAVVHQLDFENLLVTSVVDKDFIHYWDPEEAFIPHHQYPLFDPNPLLQRLHRSLWWLFTPAFVALSLGIIAFGGYLLVSRWEQLLNDMYLIWVPSMFFLLIPVGVGVVQVMHELSHGLVCTHYGGHVREAGIATVYRIIPKFYLKRSQTMMIRSRNVYKRCLVPLAGLYCQLFLGSIGIIVSSLIIGHDGYAFYFWTALWSTALWGAFHNANIAHQRDAHFVMSTYLGMAYMRERCIVLFFNWFARRPLPEPVTPHERFWLVLYGTFVPIYYTFHGLVMFWTFGDQVMYYLNSGSGVIVFLLVLAYAFHVPLMEYLHRPVRWLLASEAGSAKRWIIRLGWVALIILILLIPYPYETGGPFQILPTAQTEIHCEIDGGRIEKVHVKEGDVAVVGRPLAQIEQREYLTNVNTTQAQLDNTKAQLALLRKQFAMLTNPPNIEQIHALEAEVRRLSSLLADYKQQLELTVLRAPVNGRVTTPLVDQKVGQYLKKGDLFATMEQVHAVQVEIQVPEGDVGLVKTGARVKVVPWAYPHERFGGSVVDIAPIAAIPPANSPTGNKANSVRVLAELPNKDLRLKSQITGFAKIETRYMPLGLVLSRLMIRWFQVQFWYWLP